MTMTDLSGWRGHDVVDPSGERIGEIADIYLDEQTDQPEWLAVRTGLFGHRISFVPLAEA
jgi:sporulation protein YlmC with PRC-barrel domain